MVLADGTVITLASGQADTARREAMPRDAGMLAGSVGKTFFAALALNLVAEGRLDLDAPISRYLGSEPWFSRLPNAREITVRQLLTMTSGLPQVTETQLWTAQDDRALERMVRQLATVELGRPVGSFGYSNANYETLGLIVQEVSGLSYESYIQRHVFAPLDMRGSFVSPQEALRHGMASGHRWWFGLPVAVTFPFNRGELPAGAAPRGEDRLGRGPARRRLR